MDGSCEMCQACERVLDRCRPRFGRVMLAGIPVFTESTAELASIVRTEGADELADRLSALSPTTRTSEAGNTEQSFTFSYA